MHRRGNRIADPQGFDFRSSVIPLTDFGPDVFDAKQMLIKSLLTASREQWRHADILNDSFHANVFSCIQLQMSHRVLIIEHLSSSTRCSFDRSLATDVTAGHLTLIRQKSHKIVLRLRQTSLELFLIHSTNVVTLSLRSSICCDVVKCPSRLFIIMYPWFWGAFERRVRWIHEVIVERNCALIILELRSVYTHCRALSRESSAGIDTYTLNPKTP